MMIRNLSKEELIKLIYAYDQYINDIVESLDLPYPVSVEEFYKNDYKLYLRRKKRMIKNSTWRDKHK